MPRKGNSGRKGKKGGKTLFFPPKNKEIAEIIRIDSPKNAKKSVKQLAKLIDSGKLTIDKAIKYVTLAGNRAKAGAKRKNLSRKEKQELKEVAEIYDSFKDSLKKAKKLIGIK